MRVLQYQMTRLDEMKMRLAKKLTKVVLVATLTLACISSVSVFAGDGNHEFKFQIGSHWGNGSIEKGRYRSTTNPNNMWKVNLVTSGEGKGTYTDFWLENKNRDNVSGDIRAKQGAGAYYKAAYSSASKTTVYLTGENNNYNGDTYYVSGYWDEETGKLAG